jgi:hypothetical protein
LNDRVLIEVMSFYLYADMYQRARAAWVKGHQHLLGLVDQMAEQRLLVWPQKKEDPNA